MWINAAFKDQKEINNNSPLCFPFVTKSLNDLVNFSIYLIGEKNEHIKLSNWCIFAMSRRIRSNKTSQQIKEEQINFLIEDIEKNLDEYKRALEIKDKQLSDVKRILQNARISYNKVVRENQKLKKYIENIKVIYHQYQQQ